MKTLRAGDILFECTTAENQNHQKKHPKSTRPDASFICYISCLPALISDCPSVGGVGFWGVWNQRLSGCNVIWLGRRFDSTLCSNYLHNTKTPLQFELEWVGTASHRLWRRIRPHLGPIPITVKPLSWPQLAPQLLITAAQNCRCTAAVYVPGYHFLAPFQFLFLFALVFVFVVLLPLPKVLKPKPQSNGRGNGKSKKHINCALRRRRL